MVGSGGVGKSALTLQFMYDEVRLWSQWRYLIVQKLHIVSLESDGNHNPQSLPLS